MRQGLIWLAGCALLAGCGDGEKIVGKGGDNAMAESMPVPSTRAPVAAPAALETDGWIGRWVGVEGLALQISAGGAQGKYRLDMSLMDSSAMYEGTAAGKTIQFRRDGKLETLRHTAGAKTGLKWLADKKDCLTVKPGIGFCRD